MKPARIALALSSAALALSLGACTYDYLQHTDNVGYHAGNAVRANLERETTNPTKSSMYDRSGLGKNGEVIASGAAPAQGAPAAAP